MLPEQAIGRSVEQSRVIADSTDDFFGFNCAFCNKPFERRWKQECHGVPGDRNVQVIKYSIAFYRLSEGGWYDEIRHDSHDVVRGRATIAPHFHMKLRCGFKDSPKGGIEEIKRIIDNHLETLRGVVQ